MNQNQQKALDVIRLADKDYLNLNQDVVLALQNKLTRKLSGGAMMMAPPSQNQSIKPSWYALSSPGQVSLQHSEKTTALLASEESGLRQWEVDPKQNFQLALYDHQLKKLVIRRYSTMPDGKRQVIPSPSKSGAEPTAREQSTVLTSVQAIHLTHQFKEMLRSGHFTLTVLMYDKASNTVNFEIQENEDDKEKNNVIFEALTVNSVSVASAPVEGVRLESFSGSTSTLSFSLNAKNISEAICESTQKLHASLGLLKLDSANSFVIDMQLSIPPNYSGESSLTWGLDLADHIAKNSLSGVYQAYLTLGKTWSPAFEIDISVK